MLLLFTIFIVKCRHVEIFIMYVADFFTIERFFISAYFRVYVGMQIMNVMSKYVMKLSTIYKVFHRSMENVSMTKREKYIHLASVIEFDLKNSPFLCFFDWIVLDALANTIKNCLTALNKLPDKEAKYYCGYTLMKYCAVHLGLDQIPLKNDF